MKLEDQVCSLELAKKLKELGVKQESLYAWNKQRFGTHLLGNNPNYDCHIIDEWIAAFTVAELAEMLPDEIERKWLTIMKSKNVWEISYDFVDNGEHWDSFYDVEDSSQANAIAKVLIHLIENKLIEVPNGY